MEKSLKGCKIQKTFLQSNLLVIILLAFNAKRTNMISIALLDDERSALDETRSCLDRYFKEINEEVSINEFQDPSLFLKNYSLKYDIIFLDIQMAERNGMDVAKKIREIDTISIIVFVTNMANLAVKGYEVDASDFIVKPLEYFSFKIKMNRIMERARQNREIGSILVQTEDGKMKIRPSSIRYVEVFKHKLIYHLDDGNFQAYGSLSQVENELGKDFSRCANCYLVNLRYVKKIDGYNLYLAGEKDNELQISRSKKKGFMDDLNAYIGKGKMYVL